MYRFAIMIKLLYCVDDMVILNKSVFSEMSQGYDRLLASSRVSMRKILLIVGLSCPSVNHCPKYRVRRVV